MTSWWNFHILGWHTHFHFLMNEYVTWKSSWWSASDTIGSSLSSSSTESLQNFSWNWALTNTKWKKKQDQASHPSSCPTLFRAGSSASFTCEFAPWRDYNNFAHSNRNDNTFQRILWTLDMEFMVHLWVQVHSPGVMHKSKMCVVQFIMHLHEWMLYSVLILINSKGINPSMCRHILKRESNTFPIRKYTGDSLGTISFNSSSS